MTGAYGAVASIAWDPARVTVGASGAIFGLLGALLAYLLREKAKVPRSIFRAHWLPTALFAVFNIISGALQPQIDNIVHVGGFIAGCLLGWLLARPLDSRTARPVWSISTAVSGLFLVALLSGLLLFAFAGTRFTPSQRFLADNKWYSEGEVSNLRLWQQLAMRAQSGVLSGSDLSDQFEKNVLPFWVKADAQMASEIPRLRVEQRHFGSTFLRYIKQRVVAAREIVRMSRSYSPDQSKVASSISQLESIQSDIERQETESTLMQRLSALSQAKPFLWLENIILLDHRKCTEYPPAWETPVAETDSPADGPARTHALGCLAQKLFLTRDYKTLDGLLNQSVHTLGDLPDGSSSYEAMTGGLSSLFVFGGMDVTALWGRIVAWHLERPGSSQPGLAETQLLMDWGYQARGGGTVDTISGNAMQAFVYRTKMAASLLPDIEARSPWWFKLSIEANLYLSGDKKEMRAIFDRGHAMFSADLALDRAMLRTLMPRWSGSYQEVLKFVNEQARLEPDGNRASQRGARLLWQYSSMENDEVDIFKDLGVKWDGMAYGLAGLTAQYPHSDFIRNGLAKMACIAGDKVEYSLFAARLPKAISASAWSEKVSIPICNRKFGIKPAV